MESRIAVGASTGGRASRSIGRGARRSRRFLRTMRCRRRDRRARRPSPFSRDHRRDEREQECILNRDTHAPKRRANRCERPVPKKRKRRCQRRGRQRKPDHRLPHTIEGTPEHWGARRSNRHRGGKRNRYRGNAHHVAPLEVKCDQSKIHITSREERATDRVPLQRRPIAHDGGFALSRTWNDAPSCRCGNAEKC